MLRLRARTLDSEEDTGSNPVAPQYFLTLNFKHMQKICSSNTIEGLERLINEYFCSSSYRVLPDLTITNSKGVYDKMCIIKKKDRFIAYFK